MELSDYLRALVRGWWLIAIFGLVGLAVGLLLPMPSAAAIVKETHWVSGSSFGSAPPAPGGGDNFSEAGSAPTRSSTTPTATRS